MTSTEQKNGRMISEAALIGRINNAIKSNALPPEKRRLAEGAHPRAKYHGKRLHRCAERSKSFNTLGRWYLTLEDDPNYVTDCNIDLEDFAREIGVMLPNERIEE